MLENNLSIYDLFSNLRHELRTPINAIIGYSEMLLEDLEETQDPERFCKLQQINVGGRELLTIINQYLSSSDKSILSIHEMYQLFEDIRVEITPSLTRLIEDCDTLKAGVSQEIFSDLERIERSAHSLQELINLPFQDLIKSVQENIPGIERFPLSTFQTDYLDPDQFHILVVDDNANNRDLLSRQLHRENYRVSTAVNGKQALEMVEAEGYDLILLDLLMPEMNGYQVLRELKSAEPWRDLPVIMISANEEIEQVVQCIAMGADDYLSKPFNTILLKARIGASLEKKRLRDKERKYSQLISRELEKGRQMQLDFLPRESALQLTGWEMKSFFKPAYQMAGDFYDSFRLDQDNIAIVIADVCDKGVGAALFMALFRSLIRIFADTNLQKEAIMTGESSTNLVHSRALESLKLTNNYVAQHHGDLTMFATIFYGILNTETGLLSYINAGHEPVLIIDVGGAIINQLKSTGPSVGILPGIDYKIQQTNIDPGLTLFSFTDGLPEAKNKDGKFFSMEQVSNLLQKPYATLDKLVENITEKVIEHIGEEQQFDDITILALKRLPGKLV